jgi:hypothetical protein
VTTTVSDDRSPRRDFRVLTRRRGGYDGAVMVDVQLQVASTGALVWAQTFSDDAQAEDFQRQLEEDLDTLDDDRFRRKYGVPSSA